ncbi:hypothetical protein ABUW04_06965 [Streptacidiphilus sp. N1-10]|uniref:MinD-like ATPase involved in chromosome partitioning or flagellar assembly n=1 Tax=Streptacidiphilus jeojiensis TaxID=3229225 RepID=A0ABV6XIA9_9ACTN
MSGMIVMGAAKGAPGVSTSALALAAAWPGSVRPVVWEADASGGDLTARFRLSDEPGLVSLAGSLHARELTAQLVSTHSQVLPGGVPAVVGPQGHSSARAALAALAPCWKNAAPGLAPWIVDLGRADLELGYAPEPLRAADVVVLVSGGSVAALSHLSRLVERVRGLGEVPVVVAVVGQCPFSDAEVREALPVAGCVKLAHDPAAAAMLAGARPARTPWWRGRTRFPLLEDSARLANLLGPYLPVHHAGPADAVSVAEASGQRPSLSTYLAQGGTR